jgi:hypothetical protein
VKMCTTKIKFVLKNDTDLQGNVNTVEPVYNDIGVYDTLYITSDILW